MLPGELKWHLNEQVSSPERKVGWRVYESDIGLKNFLPGPAYEHKKICITFVQQQFFVCIVPARKWLSRIPV